MAFGGAGGVRFITILISFLYSCSCARARTRIPVTVI